LNARMQGALSTLTRRKPPTSEFRILQNVSGTFHPGRVTLVLGPPAGGKSTLMKACCGSAPVQITGELTYNGHKQSEFNVRRTARYVDQFDLHIPMLTVRETLMFSARVQGPGYHRSARPAPACCR
jgi:ABC-type multidrug transport system ATPase subunit